MIFSIFFKGGNEMLTLKESVVGKRYIVKKIHGSGPLKRRIMDMGITKNS